MSLNLRIKIGEMSRMMRFEWTATVYDVVNEIKERSPDGGKDHALFYRNFGQDDPRGMWLQLNKTLESYDLKTNDELWFRKKHDLITVRLADSTEKKMLQDISLTVKVLIPKICKKIGLKKSDAYALQFDKVFKYLKTSKSLVEQGDISTTVILKKRYYLPEGEVDKSEEMELHLIYFQDKENVVSGLYPTTKDEAIMFAALQAQIEFGAHDPNKHKVGYLKLKDMLPPAYLKKESEKEIIQNWKTVTAFSPTEAKLKYHQLAMTLRTYGHNLFPVQQATKNEKNDKKKNLTPMMLGFNCNNCLRMSMDCRVVFKEHPYDKIKRWVFSDNDVLIDFGDSEQEYLICVTKDGEEIATLIQGYTENFMKRFKQIMDNEDEETQTATENKIAIQKGKINISYTTTKQTQDVKEMATNVSNVSGCYKLMNELFIDIGEEISSEGKKSTLTDEQWKKQLDTHAQKILAILPTLGQAIFNSDTAQEIEQSRLLAVTMTLMANASKGASSSYENQGYKQSLLEETNNIIHAVSKYLEIAEKLKADPKNPVLLREFAIAQQAVESAICGMLASASHTVVDAQNRDLLSELAKQVAANIGELCEFAETAAPGNQAIAEKCAYATMQATILTNEAYALGSMMTDPGVQARFATKLNEVQTAYNELVKTVAQVAPTSTTEMTFKVAAIEDTVKMMSAYLSLNNIDIGPEKLTFLKAANALLDETNNLISMNAMTFDLVAPAAVALKDNLPVVVARMKKMSSEVDDTTREKNIVQTRNMAIGTRQIVAMCAETTFTPDNRQKIQECAVMVNQAAAILVADEQNLMIKVALVDTAKEASHQTLKLGLAARKASARANPNNKKTLLQAALRANESVKDLLDALKNVTNEAGDARKPTHELMENSKTFCPIIAKEVMNPVKQVAQTIEEEEKAALMQECRDTMKSLQRFMTATKNYTHVGALENIQYATEPYRAADAELHLAYFQAEADIMEIAGVREAVFDMLPQDSTDFAKTLRALPDSTKSQEALVGSTQEMVKTGSKLLRTYKALAGTLKTKKEQRSVLEAALNLSAQMYKLLGSINTNVQAPSEGSAQMMNQQIGSIVEALQYATKIAKATEPLGDVQLRTDKVVADRELEEKAFVQLKTAKAEAEKLVEKIAKQAKETRDKANEEGDPALMVRASILEAVLGMVSTTGTVISSAASAQEELVSFLKSNATDDSYSRDPKLAEGLIEAAQQISTSVSALSASTDDENVSQNQMVELAQGVSKSVEKVVFAVRAGVKKKSSSHQRLYDAAAAVSKATAQLVQTAKELESVQETSVGGGGENFGIDEYTLKEIKINMRIAELEKKYQAALRYKERLENAAKQQEKDQNWKSV